MRTYVLEAFGVEHLKLVDREPPPLGPGQVLVKVDTISLNYRDLLVVNGLYNPKLRLPTTPVSDGAGTVTAVGAGVTRVKVGDAVMSHFVSGWLAGPFHQEYLETTLGTPAAGLAAEQVVLPAEAVVRVPGGYDFAQAATLPIAALTAWSVLVTVGHVQAGQIVLTLGTGGVSIFALQLAKALGARVIITSGSDAKLARARELGADHTVNYKTHPQWERQVLEFTQGAGVDVTVETVGPGTLDRSLKATRAGGIIGLLGALTGRAGQITTGLLMMKRIQLHGIMVDSRAAFEDLVHFIEQHSITPVIDARYAFEELPRAFADLAAGRHFGKLVITL